ncbi:fasciclin domain-containing protein [Halanaerobiaceae bacterium Z-7014]|uniref:Fasciclin domain-containing protein n=1 Tax=Halonatronomonas betaini TaxID=2778430 RepID=A0A931FAF1_9FIRM|nr:fasciclin domain-containing protein [Halonatronomonas betaini]MBF8436902.1 fasciclin domain-containing protein [Halonatronomonas betaini]
MKKSRNFFRVGFLALTLALVLFLTGCTNGLTDTTNDIIDEGLNDIVGTADDAGVFETLLAAAEEAGLVDALKAEGPLTVFAPNDKAFEDFLNAMEMEASELLADPRLANVLKYHVVPGKVMSTDLSDGMKADTLLNPQQIEISINEGVFLNEDIEVITPDVEASNGVIHVIDGVLWPADIVETAVANGFDTLVTAVVTADLVEALQGPGLFTVFAPINEAFDALPSGVLEELLDNPEDLADVLLFHVVSGQVMAETVVGLDGQEVETLLGETIEVTIEDGKVFINDSEVIITDIQTLNGVIHVIDRVLLPQD